jgi:hypothetical protein
MKTSSKSLTTIAIVSLFAAGLVFAATDEAAPAARSLRPQHGHPENHHHLCRRLLTARLPHHENHRLHRTRHQGQAHGGLVQFYEKLAGCEVRKCT